MRTLAIAVIVCAAVALPHATRAATFIVNSTDDGVDSAPGDGVCVGPAGTCTLRGAILEANALAGADTITLPAGKFALQFPGADEDAGWKGDLDITDDLVIDGAGETASIISGNRIDRVFDVHSPAQVTLSDMTITNGEAPAANGSSDLHSDGGGLLNDGTLTLISVTFFRNYAGRGEGSGGGLTNIGTATLMHVTFHQNRAGNASAFDFAGDIGGMWNAGTATLTDVTFSGNRAGDGFNGEDGNDGGQVGGMENDGDAILTNVTFRTNRAGDGRNGGYGGEAGGMENDGTATLAKVTFDRNRAGNGGAVELYPEGGPGGDGGGMYNYGYSGGTVTLTDVSFIGNRAGHGRAAFSDGGRGGGMYNDGHTTLINVTFDRNRAGDGHFGYGGDGGGILDDGSATLTNVTLTRNRAGNAAAHGSNYGVGGSGGGLNTRSATLTNVTLALNRAGRGTYGGPEVDNGAGNQIAGGATLTNTIIFGPGPSCGGVASMGHNLDSGTTCGFTATGDLSNTDPLLDKLKSNGGFTPTMALRPGSPAIDAGNDGACPATDQRGVARPQGGACDIGAYEVQQ